MGLGAALDRHFEAGWSFDTLQESLGAWTRAGSTFGVGWTWAGWVQTLDRRRYLEVLRLGNWGEAWSSTRRQTQSLLGDELRPLLGRSLDSFQGSARE
jgi:hypothetical protein